MAWIEVHQSLPTHRKTRRLARELKLNGKDFPKAVGHLVMLWLWAIDNAPSGDLGSIDPYDVADAAEWSGDPEKFMDALKKSGFVDEDMHIHDWDAYIGKLIDRREANAQRNREARAKKRAERITGASRSAARDSNERITGASRDDTECASRAGDEQTTGASRDIATVPNPTVPNPTVPNQPNRTSSSSPLPAAGGEEGKTAEEEFPPTVEMAAEYIREKDLRVDAGEFIARCEAAGWRDGKGDPVTNWRLWLKGYALRHACPAENGAAPFSPDPRLAALEAMKGGKGR